MALVPVTPAQQQDIYRLAVGMYGAAPGVTYYNELAVALNAGMSLAAIYDVLANSLSFQGLNPGYSNTATNQQFATAFIESLLGTAATADAKALAVTFMLAKLNAGQSRGSVMHQAIDALDGMLSTDPIFGGAAARFDAHVGVAKNYTEVLGGSETDLGRLQQIVSDNPQPENPPVPQGGGGGGGSSIGSTLFLTPAVDDVLMGTSLNDTFIGDDTTANSTDKVTGGLGFDTLKLTNTSELPQLKEVEKIHLIGDFKSIDISTIPDVFSLEIEAFPTNSKGNSALVRSDQAVKLSDLSQNSTLITVDAGKSLTLTLNNAGGPTASSPYQVALDATKGNKLTDLSLVSSTADSNIQLVDFPGDLKTITYTGNKNVKLDLLSFATDIDASKATGGLDVTINVQTKLTFTGGSGNDRINMTNTLSGADTLTGGPGIDIFAIGQAGDLTSNKTANVKGFDILEVTTADATAYDVSEINLKDNPLTGIRISESGGGGTTINNINSGSVNAITFIGDSPTKMTLTAAGFQAGGSADTATIILDNSVLPHKNGVDIQGFLNFANVDVLNVKSVSDGSPFSGEQNSIVNLQAPDLQKIVVSGDQSLFLKTDNATANLAEVNASALKAALKLDTSASQNPTLLVTGTAESDDLILNNNKTLATTIFLGGQTGDQPEFATLTGGGTSAHSFLWTAAKIDTGDMKAGGTVGITLSNVAAGDKVTLDFTSGIEAQLKSDGTVLGDAAKNVKIYDSGNAGPPTTFSPTTNIIATESGGTLNIQVDLDADAVFDATKDYQLQISGTGTDDRLVYNAGLDVFVFTVV